MSIKCKNCCKQFNCREDGKENCGKYMAESRLSLIPKSGSKSLVFKFSKPASFKWKPIINHGRIEREPDADNDIKILKLFLWMIGFIASLILLLTMHMFLFPLPMI